MDSMDMMPPHSNSGGSSSSSNVNNDFKMHMTFYADHHAQILFDQWKTSSWLYYSLSLIALFLLSVFYQWLQSHIHQFSRALSTHLLGRLLRSFQYMVAIAIAYILMLVIMTFNAGLFLVIVLGFGFGHFLFNTPSVAAFPSSADAAIKPAPACCV